MKQIEIPYIIGKHPDPENRKPLIVQTSGSQLVGVVRTITASSNRETHYNEILAEYSDRPDCLFKVDGYRLCIVIEGILNPDFNPDEAFNCSEDRKEILRQMGEFYLNNISEGMRRNLIEKC